MMRIAMLTTLAAFALAIGMGQAMANCQSGCATEEKSPTQTACNTGGCATEEPITPACKDCAPRPSKLEATLKALAKSRAYALHPVKHRNIAVGCVSSNCATHDPTASKPPQVTCSGPGC
jgi:hypothetical protein